MMIRRCLVALVLSPLFLLLLIPASGVRTASAQDSGISVSASMNSFCYVPGERAYVDVDLELPQETREGDISLELLIYPSATTRSSLASFRGDTRRYPIVRRTLETIAPESDWTDKMYEIDLSAWGLRAGVYPFEVRLSSYGEELPSDQNFLVIMDPAAGYPLNLSLLWTLDFLPISDLQGNILDGGLDTACSSDPSQNGFLYQLAKVMKRTPEVHTSMILPQSTYDDLRELAGTADEEGGEESAGGAKEVLDILNELVKGGQVDLTGTSYAFADLDQLISQGWEKDTAEQMDLGLEGAENMGAKSRGFVAPLFSLSDSVLQRTVENGLEFTVVGEDTLESSAAGRRLLEGTTISQPVDFVNMNGYVLKAFVRDEILYDFIEGTTQRDASHMIQNIFAELAVLQREEPYVVRSCVLAFPPSFVPSREFLEELYTAVKGCAWLQTRYLSELNEDQFSLEGVALQAPVYEKTQSDYMQKLSAVRDDVEDFTATMPEDHPLSAELKRSILVAESYRFTGGNDATAAQAYLNSVQGVIQSETSKVYIEQKRSVTLSSTEGKISVDVTSNLDYPLENVTLSMQNTSLSFPDGNSMVVTIEPRENRFIFDINTNRKGSFIVDIVLQADRLVIASTSTTVNTSIINTLAIILLVCLAAIVALAIIVRRLLRQRRGGKHAKGRTV
jgi:hypothetical protein